MSNETVRKKKNSIKLTHTLLKMSGGKPPIEKRKESCSFPSCNRRKVCQHKVTIDTKSLHNIFRPPTLSLLFKKLSEANIHRGKFELENYIVGDCKGIKGGAGGELCELWENLLCFMFFHYSFSCRYARFSLIAKAITCNYIKYLLSCLKLNNKSLSLIRSSFLLLTKSF